MMQQQATTLSGTPRIVGAGEVGMWGGDPCGRPSGRGHEKSHERGPYSGGVGGGRTKTLAIVVDAQGRECGRGLAGSANYNVVGLEQAVRHLYSAVEQAASMAGCQLPLHGAWLGIA